MGMEATITHTTVTYTDTLAVKTPDEQVSATAKAAIAETNHVISPPTGRADGIFAPPPLLDEPLPASQTWNASPTVAAKVFLDHATMSRIIDDWFEETFAMSEIINQSIDDKRLEQIRISVKIIQLKEALGL